MTILCDTMKLTPQLKGQITKWVKTYCESMGVVELPRVVYSLREAQYLKGYTEADKKCWGIYYPYEQAIWINVQRHKKATSDPILKDDGWSCPNSIKLTVAHECVHHCYPWYREQAVDDRAIELMVSS